MKKIIATWSCCGCGLMLAAGKQVVVGGLVEEMAFATWLVELINADPVQVRLQLGVTIAIRYAKTGGVKTTTLF